MCFDGLFTYSVFVETFFNVWTAAQEDVTFKGVVFNEMKGVYSSPDSMNGRITQQSLFPDNTYGVDSGGDPKDIPSLTYEEFKVTPTLPALITFLIVSVQGGRRARACVFAQSVDSF